MSTQEAAVRKVDDERWRQIRERVLERDGYECRFCGMTDQGHVEENGSSLDVHHIIPRNDGGEDVMENLAALCRSCHRTMESLHGQAMGQIAASEDYADDLRGVNRVFHEQRQRVDDFEEKLAEFADDHPTFADHFDVYDEGSEGAPVISSHQLEEAVGYGTEEGVRSEWQFAVAFGYKYGLLDVIGGLDGWTSVPFEGFEDWDTV